MKKPIYLLMPLMCISFLASCATSQPTHKFTFNGTNCTINGEKEYSRDIYEKDKDVKFTIVPDGGYNLPETIEGGVSYNPANGVITISEMTGDITVTATAVAKPQSIVLFTFNGNNCTINNQPIFTQNLHVGDTNVMFTIVPKDGYNLPQSLSGDAVIYDSTTGVITISEVTNAITISGDADPIIPETCTLTFAGEHLTLKDESGTPIEEEEYENGTVLRLTLEPDDEQYIYPTQEDLLVMDKEGNPYDPTLYLYDQTHGELMITIKDDIDISATTYNPYISSTEELEDMLMYFVDDPEANFAAHFVDGYNFPLCDIQASPNITHFHGYNEYDNDFGVGGDDLFSSLTSDTYIETIEKDDGTYEYYQYQPYGQKFDEAWPPYAGRGVLNDAWYKESISSEQFKALIPLLKYPLIMVLFYMDYIVTTSPIESAIFTYNHYEMKGLIELGESVVYDCKIYAANHQLTKLLLYMDGSEKDLYSNITFTYGNAPTTPPEVADSIDYEVTEEEWNNVTDNILDEGPLTIDVAPADFDLRYHVGFDENYLNYSTFFDTGDGYRIARFLPYENSQFNKDYYYYGEYERQELNAGTSCVDKMLYDEEMPFEKLYSNINSMIATTVEFINNQYDYFTYQEEQKKYTNNESFIVTFEVAGITYEVTYNQVEVQFINGYLANVKCTYTIGDEPEVPLTYITSLSYKDVKVMPPIQL